MEISFELVLGQSVEREAHTSYCNYAPMSKKVSMYSVSKGFSR